MAGSNSHSAEMPTNPKRPAIDAKAQQQAQHAATISLIVKNTGKIQKEIGFRRARLKNVYQKCNETIAILNDFKDVTWPPPPKETKEDSNGTEEEKIKSDEIGVSKREDEDSGEESKLEEEGNMKNEEQSDEGSVSDEAFDDVDMSVSASNGDAPISHIDNIEVLDGEEETIVTEAETEIETDISENIQITPEEQKDVGEKLSEEMTKLDDELEVSTVVEVEQEVSCEEDDDREDDDKQFRPEIKMAIECYCLVLSHAQASAKMIEIALECIGLMISNRYVVGSTLSKQKPQTEDGFNKESDVTDLINKLCECADSKSDAVQSAMVKDLLSLMTSPACAIHEAGMLKAFRTVFHVYLITAYEEVKQLSREVLLDMLRSVFQRMEAYDAIMSSEGGAAGLPGNPRNEFDDKAANSIFASRYHTDSYLLFRALCKLSAKLLPEDTDDSSSNSTNKSVFATTKVNASDPMATSTKILSLELILSVFEHCGPAFRDGHKFIYAVQNFLCVSLLKNCVSSNTIVAHLSLKVFLLLVYKFKNHMKAEIEVFIAKVFLPVLESPNCPFERKSLVLEALRALCADPVILTSIFLNYDCDFDAVNLYKTIVHHLTSLSIKGRSATQKTSSDNFSLSVAGLEVLVVILQGFLKALSLPGGDDAIGEERRKVRGSLTLDVGMAVKSERGIQVLQKRNSKEDMVVTAKDIENIESVEDVAGKIVDAYDKKRAAQQNFELGSIKFKLSAKQGLIFFVQNGLLKLDAKEVAAFFLTHKDKLDKTQIGEVFGREPDASFIKDEGTDPEKGGEGFYIRTLHHYVDGLDFTGLKFDDAIRLFLSGFRLPGESQKVDRIMEKFAERYTLQNEDVFPSADTAFILAFAVIMLQTDLHNPNIKPEKKMTEESFVNMNRGISTDGGDLPSEFLSDIFRSIKARPFTLKEDEDARRSMENKPNSETFYNDVFFGNAAEQRRLKMFHKERAELVESTEKLFTQNKTPSVPTTDLTSSVGPGDVVKPMYEITWGPLLGALSQILEKAADDTSIALCLNGFVYAVRIAQHTNIMLARSTFVNSLAKFTALGSIRELKPRNIESIRTLLSIAIMDGELLSDSWRPILQCISQLGRLLFFASGVDSNDDFLNSDTQNMKASQSTETRETEEINGRVVLEAINEVLIEKVFTSSTKLSDAGIMNLVDSLVLVSLAEIEGDSKKDISGLSRSVEIGSPDGTSERPRVSKGDGPRIYSLQKLVEVADYNMDIRSRLSWAKMWGVMGDHFVKIACNDNAVVSMFAIDALRQLSFKFLQKPELSDFNFQGLFLRPFLSIMNNLRTLEDAGELILQCVDNFTRTYAQNIRSGWKIFFAILASSANGASEKNSKIGMSVLQRLVDDNLDFFCIGNEQRLKINGDNGSHGDGLDEQATSSRTAREQNSSAEDFIGLCRASLAFVRRKGEGQLPMELTMTALSHVACYADKIAEGKALPPLSGAQTNDSSSFGFTYEGLTHEEELTMVLWRPIIDGLSAGIRSTAPTPKDGIGSFVQRGCLITLRAILLRHGKNFTCGQWRAMMEQAILPSIEAAVKSDASPVAHITSECPHISSLDFLAEPIPLPPPEDDSGLLAFAFASRQDEGCLGQAELLVEASFADLRFGGNGDLSMTHLLLNKEAIHAQNVEEPFPDSWIATCAPIALGMLTDIFCCIVLSYSVKDARELYGLTMGQMQKWALGTCSSFESIDDLATERYCEALVRIGCKEIAHLSETLFTLFPLMDDECVKMWLGFLCENLAEVLSYSVELEGALHMDMSNEINDVGAKSNRDGAIDNIDTIGHSVKTPYGNGIFIDQRNDDYDDGIVKISIISLDSGATLYGLFGPAVDTISDEVSTNGISPEESKGPAIADITEKYISPLRCAQKDITLLADAVEKSRAVSCKASVDKKLSAYFEEAMRMEWGGRVEEPQAAFSSDSGVGHQGRSEMFFLTQEASANNVLIRLLSLLYCPRNDEKVNEWDTVSFAEPILMTRMVDVMQKFIVSERENGHKIDANVWRVHEAGGKFAVHCTSFAAVVANILYTMIRFSDDQFDRQKSVLFPILCSLISIQSEDIRMLVATVLRKKVSVLLDIPNASCSS